MDVCSSELIQITTIICHFGQLESNEKDDNTVVVNEENIDKNEIINDDDKSVVIDEEKERVENIRCKKHAVEYASKVLEKANNLWWTIKIVNIWAGISPRIIKVGD